MCATLAGYVHHAVSRMFLAVRSLLGAVHIKTRSCSAPLVPTTPHAREDVERGRSSVRPAEINNTAQVLLPPTCKHTCHLWRNGNVSETKDTVKECVRVYHFSWAKRHPAASTRPWQKLSCVEQEPKIQMGTES